MSTQKINKTLTEMVGLLIKKISEQGAEETVKENHPMSGV